MNPTTMRGPGHSARSPVRFFLMLAGAGVITWLGWANRTAFSSVLQGIVPASFLLAVVAGVTFTATQGFLYVFLVRKHGEDADARRLVAVFLLSQPAKYVPGKIWMPLMQSMALGTQLRLVHFAIANVELAAIGIVQMTALGLACLWRQSPALAALSLVTGLGACVLMLRYSWVSTLGRLVPFIARRLGLERDDVDRRPGFVRVLLPCLVAFGANLAASWLVLRAAGEAIPRVTYAPLLATLYLGFAAGILAVPVPAGMGVREMATVGLGRMLAVAIPSSLMVSVALLARVWQLVVDAACFVLGAALLLPHAKDVTRR